MDEGQEEHQGIDYFGPGIVLATFVAFMGDMGSLLVFGGVIPVIGLVFLAAGLLAHYCASIFVGGFLFFELKHFVPKVVLGAAILLPAPMFPPFPTLTIGIIAALILQNRIIEQLAIQATAVAVGVATAGAGGVAVEAGAQAAAAGGRAAATTAARAGAGQAARTGETAAARGAAKEEESFADRARKTRRPSQGGGAEEGGEEEPEVPEEELGVEPDPLEQLRRSMEKLPPIQRQSQPEETEEPLYLDKTDRTPQSPEILGKKLPQKNGENPKQPKSGDDIISLSE
jgi:hypothetical protein